MQKKFSTYVISISIILLNVSTANSYEWKGTKDRFEIAPGITVGGSFRVRYEHKDDFKFNKDTAGTDDSRTLTQFRFNTKWDPSEWFTLFVEGQDAQVHGENATTNENAVPSPVFVNDPWDLHQAYIDLRCTNKDTPSVVRVGRQKLNFGTQRLIGALEWVNTARVWDAVKVTLGEQNNRTLTGFAAQQVAVDPNNPNDWADVGTARYQDSDLYGIYYTDWKILEDVQLELYWLFRDNEDTSASGSATSGGDEVHSIGSRFETVNGPWDFNGEFVGQFGDYSGLDHSAFAAHIEGGYKVESLNNTRFSSAYNYASGDDDSTDGDHNTFDNLYPTNHKFYGYMDFFAWANMHNLETAVSTKLFDKVPVKLALHWFWLDEEDTDSLYGAGRGASRTAVSGTDVDSFVGKEIDLTAKYWIVPKRVNLLLGYSHFFAGDYLSDTGISEDADFFYVQTALNF